MARHKWNNKTWPSACVNCGIIRRRVTGKLLMAITLNGKSHYKYYTYIEYSDINDKILKYKPCTHNP